MFVAGDLIFPFPVTDTKHTSLSSIYGKQFSLMLIYAPILRSDK